MKKIFKMLGAAFLVAVTFVSAGCSCKLSDEKIVERVRALESSVVYGLGTDDYQDFTMTAIINSDSKEYKYVFDTDMNNDKTFATVYVDGVKEGEETLGHAEDVEFVNEIYDAFKDQPINAFGEMTNGKYRELIGLETATDDYLKIENIEVSAKKKLFKNEVTFVIEYRVAVRENYRQTIVINGDNKITNVKLENIVTTVLNGGGDTKEITYTLLDMEIKYK
jgi:hypothetical protein